MPRRFIRSGPRRSATSWTFLTSLRPVLALLRLSKIIDQPNRSWTPATRSSSFAAERFTKNLRSDRRSKQKPLLTTVEDETAQARYVAQKILDAREAGVALKSQATLFRASHHSAQLELELARRNIPFVKYGGLKFLEAAHVKDMLSVLRWCENVGDRIAGFRVLQLLPGIGPTTAGKILDETEGRPILSRCCPELPFRRRRRRTGQPLPS